MRIGFETPREIGSYVYDVGRHAIKGFIKRMDASPKFPQRGASVELPMESEKWGAVGVGITDEHLDAFADVLRELQSEQLDQAA